MGPVKVVFVNIALNSGGNQARQGLLCGRQHTDVRGTVGHQRHVQSANARLQRVRKGWVGGCIPSKFLLKYTLHHETPYDRPCMPRETQCGFRVLDLGFRLRFQPGCK